MYSRKEQIMDIISTKYNDLEGLLDEAIIIESKRNICSLLEFALRYNNNYYSYDKIWLKYYNQ